MSDLSIDPKLLIKQLITELNFLALKSKDVPAYLQAHATLLQATLKPRGLGYTMRAGDNANYILAQHLEDLQTPFVEGQVRVIQPLFANALANVWQIRQAIVLPPDVSKTDYHHYFVPCVVHGQVVYVLHFWFDVHHPLLKEDTLSFITAATNAMGVFLKIQNFPELSQSITQSTSHTQLMEEMAGQKDLEAISWNLVNYAREALQCNRVCLFTIKNYTQSFEWSRSLPIHERAFVIQACSGLKKVNKRGEQAVIVSEMAKALLCSAFDKVKLEDNRDQPKMVIGIAKKEANIRAERPQAITYYFQRVPMSWAVGLPLYDKMGLLCGILLFEGQTIPQNLALNILRMRLLAQAAGPAIGASLKWERHWSLKCVTKWAEFLAKITPSWKKSMSKKWAMGIGALLVIACFPFPYRLKGSATISPVLEDPIPAYRSAELLTRPFLPGDRVKSGDILAILDTEELNAALANAKSELYQAEAAIGRARILNQTFEESQARITSKAALERIQSIELSLEQSIIRASFDGLLTGPSENRLKIGSIVTPGEIVANVINPMEWKVHLNLREQDMIALENRLTTNGSASGQLNLLALPNQSFELKIADKSQITYGVDPFRDDYHYTVTFYLTLPEEAGCQLRKGYVGDAYVSIGWRTLAHLFFHDFIVFCKVRL